MSNSAYPWFRWYVRDALSDPKWRRLGAMGRGCFMQLASYQWEDGILPVDPLELGELAAISEAEVGLFRGDHPFWSASAVFLEFVWPRLEEFFPTVEGPDGPGRKNPKIDAMRIDSVTTRLLQSEGGRATAAKRAGKQAVRARTSDSDSDAEKKKTSVRKRTGGRKKSTTGGYKYPAAFDRFWGRYPERNGKRCGKRATYTLWNKLPDADKGAAFIAAGHYAQSKIARVDGKARDPERFLKQDYWRDWVDGPGTDEHVEERDRIRPPEPQATSGGPPALPDDVAAELGFGSLREAARGLPGARSADEISGDLEKEGGGLTEHNP